MPGSQELYQRLSELQTEISHLQSAYSAIDYEVAVEAVPAAGVDQRAEILGVLASVAHAKQTSAEYGDLLGALIEAAEDGDLGPTEAAAVRKAWQDYDWDRRLPAEFVERNEEANQRSQAAWKQARDASDWATMLPHLERVVELAREKAALLRHGQEPYDALLEEYEEGLTAEAMQRTFDALEPQLVELVREIAASPSAKPSASDVARYDACRRMGAESQRALCRQVARTLGFAPDRGMIGESKHPFCVQINLGDTRMALSYRPADLFWAVGSATHEAGHWLYLNAQPDGLYGTALHGAPSLSADEAISRFYENVVGRSLGFVEWLSERFMGDWQPAFVHRMMNQVQPGCERMFSDEVTYDLHIMLRASIERPLINGSLPVREVPEAWNGLSRELLGVTPPDHRLGVLQDDHWFAGWFGYFPTYTRGNLISSQLRAAALNDMPDMEERFARGEFASIREWLDERFFRHASFHETEELVKAATGEPLDPAHHIARLRERYGAIYGL